MELFFLKYSICISITILWARLNTAMGQTCFQFGSWWRLISQPGCLLACKHNLVWAMLGWYRTQTWSLARPAQAWAGSTVQEASPARRLVVLRQVDRDISLVYVSRARLQPHMHPTASTTHKR